MDMEKEVNGRGAKEATKSKPAAGDDVILYMDELPASNGLHEDTKEEEEEEEEEAAEEREHGEVGVEENPVPSIEGPMTLENLNGRHLETDNVNKPRTRHDGYPEVEVFDPEEFVPVHIPKELYPGVDDGLLPDDGKPSMGPSLPRPTADDGPMYNPRGPAAIPDLNIYQQKKTIAQGMMDLALISANANQFRYVLQSSGSHPYYYPSLTMISMSLILQVVVGIGLIWNSRYNVKHEAQIFKANRANNWTVIAVFLVTILNVFISSFGVVEVSTVQAPPPPSPLLDQPEG